MGVQTSSSSSLETNMSPRKRLGSDSLRRNLTDFRLGRERTRNATASQRRSRHLEMSISSIVLHNLVGVASGGPGETSEGGLEFLRSLTRLWRPAMLTFRPLILRDLRMGQLAPTRARVSSLTMSDRSRCWKERKVIPFHCKFILPNKKLSVGKKCIFVVFYSIFVRKGLWL